VVVLSAEIKRGFLNSLARKTADTSTALADALTAFQDQSFSAVKSGRLIVTHSGAGKSVTFQLPEIGRMFSQEQVFALTQEFLEVYSDAKITLSAQGNSSPDDPSILAVMLADIRLADIDCHAPDFTGLGWPYGT
jgi:hypothetical protein